MTQEILVADAVQIESLEKIRLMANGHHEMIKILGDQAVEVLGMDRENESYEANAIRKIAREGSTVDEAIFDIANNRLLEEFDADEPFDAQKE